MSNYEDFSKNFNNGKNVFAVIHFNNGKEKEALSILSQRSLDCLRGGFLAFILHDRDTDENGNVKVPHVHVVLEADKAQSKQNWINSLADGFGVSREAVGVQALGVRRGAVRYLIHADNKDKYQYDVSEILTTDSKAVADCFIAQKSNNPDFDVLMACNSYREIYDLVGLQNFAKAKKAYEELNDEKSKTEYFCGKYQDLLDRLYKALYRPDVQARGVLPVKDIVSCLDDDDRLDLESRYATEKQSLTAFKASQNERKKGNER